MKNILEVMQFLIGFLISLWCFAFINADRGPPRIEKVSGYSGPLKLHKNIVLTLVCIATGEKPLKYLWQHNGSAVVHSKGDRVSSYEGTIVIVSLKQEDEGDYRCVVENDLGIVFSEDIVVKFSYVNDFLLADNDQNIKTLSAEIGKPFQIDCPTFRHSKLTKYSWGTANKDGTIFRLKVGKRVMVSSSGSLVFAWLTQSDVDSIQSKGGISCIIQNIDGTEIRISHKYKLNVTGIASITDIKPRITEELSSVYEAVKGEKLILRCSASGRPAPTISWYKDGQKVSQGGGHTFNESNHVLRLDPVSDDMSAQYKCVAKSSIATEESQQASSQTNVVVKSPPLWISKPGVSTTQSFMSKTYNLKCKASGNPGPVYSWYRNGKKLTIDSSKFKVDNHVLQVTDLTSDDKGVYQCIAENKYGKIVAGQYLNVTALAPTFDDVQFGPFKIYLGHKAVLRCEPEAAPEPKKVWEKNGESIIYNDSKYGQTSQGDLIIFNVDKKDQANYTCHVQNIAGRDQATAAAFVSKKSSSASSWGRGPSKFTLYNPIIHFFFVLIMCLFNE